MSYEEDRQRCIKASSKEVVELLESMGFQMCSSYMYPSKHVLFIKPSPTKEEQIEFYFEGCKTKQDVMLIIYETFFAMGKNQKIKELNQVMKTSRDDITMRDINRRNL